MNNLIVVGAGILGLATAYRAREQGQAVTVIEADSRAVGASVQNFGHAAFTVQDEAVEDVADRSRQGWTDIAGKAALWASQPGTWIPAATDLEMQVLSEFAGHRGSDTVRLVSREEVARGIGNESLEAVGGAHLPKDMRVNPREAAGRIAAWLADDGVKFIWNTRVLSAADGTVETTRGSYTAEQVIVCTGTALDQIFPEVAEKWEMTNCTLSMMLIDRPAHIPADLAMLTGTGIGRYTGFTAMPSAPQLREELAAREPGLVGIDANLMVTAIPEGLLIGDSHSYSRTPYPFIEESTAQLLLDKAAATLGIDAPVVRQRWLGRYASSPQGNLIVEKIDERTTVGVMSTGSGMTLSFGLAELFLSGETVAGY